MPGSCRSTWNTRGYTVFNQNSQLFTGVVTLNTGRTRPLTESLTEGASLYRLNLSEIREINVLHELAHAYDVNGEYEDGNGTPESLNNGKRLNLALRRECGFPAHPNPNAVLGRN